MLRNTSRLLNNIVVRNKSAIQNSSYTTQIPKPEKKFKLSDYDNFQTEKKKLHRITSDDKILFVSTLIIWGFALFQDY